MILMPMAVGPDFPMFRVRTGSHLYGTNTPESDEDFIEVYLCEPRWYLGLRAVDDPKGKQSVLEDGTDVTRFEFRHFLRLCRNFNPNVVEVLQSPELTHCSETAAVLRINRDRFVSQRGVDALVGYAKGMLHATKKPEITGQAGAKRKILIDKFGFDTKAASHAYRLAWTASALAMTGQHMVDLSERPLAQCIVKNIRAGVIPLESILTLVEDRLAVTKAHKGRLPEQPDDEWINDFCISTLRGWTR